MTKKTKLHHITNTITARPEVRGKPGDKKAKKKVADDDNDKSETIVTTKRKKRKAKGKEESDDDQEDDELSDEDSNPDVDMASQGKEKGKDKSDDDTDDHHTLNMGLGSRGSGSAPYVPSFAGSLGRILTSKSESKSPSIALPGCRDMVNHTRYNLIKLMKTEIDKN